MGALGARRRAPDALLTDAQRASLRMAAAANTDLAAVLRDVDAAGAVGVRARALDAWCESMGGDPLAVALDAGGARVVVHRVARGFIVCLPLPPGGEEARARGYPVLQALRPRARERPRAARRAARGARTPGAGAGT